MTSELDAFHDARRSSTVEENPRNAGHPVSAFFLDYWRRKLRGRKFPLAADFVPKEVRANLRWVVLIDALPDYSDFRYRLVGSSVCEYFLGSGTGKTVSEVFASDRVARGIASVYRRACELEKPLRVTGPPITVSGVFFPTYDCLYLPYSTDGQKVDRLVNTFVFTYDAI
jgi:hypothetical protein